MQVCEGLSPIRQGDAFSQVEQVTELRVKVLTIRVTGRSLPWLGGPPLPSTFLYVTVFLPLLANA